MPGTEVWQRQRLASARGPCDLERQAGAAAHVAAFLIIPRSSVVGLRGRIKSRVEPVLRQLETVLHDESSVGVIEQVILGDAIVFDGVADHSAQKCDIRAGANLKEQI